MATTLSPLFTNLAIGTVEAGVDFAMHPQQTINQISNPQRLLGLGN